MTETMRIAAISDAEAVTALTRIVGACDWSKTIVLDHDVCMKEVVIGSQERLIIDR